MKSSVKNNHYKKITLAIGMTATCIILCSCARNDNPETVSENEASTSTESSEETIDYVSIYDEILTQCKKYATEGYEQGTVVEDGMVGIVESLTYIDNPAEHIGYCINDVTGDGIPELIICQTDPKSDKGAPEEGNVFALYTCIDNEPTLVLQGMVRSSYFYCGNKTFYHYGSGGAASQAIGLLELSGDGTTYSWLEYCFVEYDAGIENGVVYTNSMGEADNEASQITDMDGSDFMELQNSYEDNTVELETKLISEYE